MGKPSDKQDATQPLTPSQIVTVTPRSPPAIDPNDRSVWKQVVVGADDFAVAPVKRRSNKTGLVIALGVLLAGGIAATIYVVTRGSSDSAVGPDAAVPMAMPPADAAVIVDAPAVDAPVDAAIDAPIDAPVDAAAPEDAGVRVDAGVPAKPPVKKKPPAKKPPAKRPKPR